MTDLVLSGKQEQLSMSSLDLLEMINKARLEQGQAAIRRNDFHARVADELSEEYYETFVVQNSNNTTTEAFRISRDQCLLVAMRESKAVRRTVLAKLKALDEPKAPAWLESLSPQARIAIEDLNDQLDHYKSETERLNTVCNDLADNLREGLTPVEFCRMLNGVHLNRVQPDLVERKRLLRTEFGYRSAAAYRDRLFTERRYLNRDGRTCEKVVLTQKGAKWLYSEYEKGRLTMRKDWDGKYSHLMFEVEVAA